MTKRDRGEEGLLPAFQRVIRRGRSPSDLRARRGPKHRALPALGDHCPLLDEEHQLKPLGVPTAELRALEVRPPRNISKCKSVEGRRPS
jgi:hypothetical protein